MHRSDSSSSSVKIRSVVNGLAALVAGVLSMAAAATSEAMVAVDDGFVARSGILLQVEAPGVLENDHDGSGGPLPASATAILDSDVGHGTLALHPDGSFDYTSTSGYTGPDVFSYHVVDGAASSNTATVTLTVVGCDGTLVPTQTVCWVEGAFLEQLAQLGYGVVYEGFEDDAVWGAARFPDGQPSVTNQGITWAANHAANSITTDYGPARTGNWAGFSDPHGDTSGGPGTFIRDGFTGSGPGGDTLYAAGGWLKGTSGGRVNFELYQAGGSSSVVNFPDNTLGPWHEFFGVIDTAGFETFEVYEREGTFDQWLYVFGDDFAVASSVATDVTPPQVVLVNSVADTGDGVLSEGEITYASITQLLVSFSEPVYDPSGSTIPHDVTNPANYLLVEANGNGFQTTSCAGGVGGNDVEVAIDGVTYVSGSLLESTVAVNGGMALPVGSYRLLVCGTTSIHDWAGNPLDGDSNGTGGDDFVRNFSVTDPPVNEPPVAHPQSVTTAEDTSVAITLTGSDPNGDPITFSLDAPPSHGTLTGIPPALTYSPAANYFGGDSFTFRAYDGLLYSAPATISITVTPVNDPPVAGTQALGTPEDTAVAITLVASDPDGDPLSYSISTPPAHGVLSGSPPNVTYTPDVNYFGLDQFSFTVSDGTFTSNAGTVFLNVTPVNDPPVADPQSVTTPQDTALAIILTGSDVDGDPLSYSIGTGPAHGSLSGTPPGVTYTPAAGYSGSDSFTFSVNDGTVTSAPAAVSITVTAVNNPPVADPQSVTTPEDTARAITLTGSDVDGDPLTFSIVTGPAHGSLSGTPPSVTYTPASNYNGPDGFTFRVWDGTVYSNTAAVSITVAAVNDPPVANPQSVSTAQNTPVAITLTGSDVDDDPLTFALGAPPSHGGLTGTPPNVTYTPTTGYFGPDSFTFTVNDGTVTSGPATVSITVTEVPLPMLTIGDASLVEGDTGSASVSLTISMNPASADPVSVGWSTGGGTATPGSDYTASAGTASFAIGATTATVSVPVLGDLMDEPNETFEVTLSNPVGATLGTPSTGTVTIIDDDPMPDLSGVDLDVLESAGQASVVLSLSRASGYDITVDYATADGTATSPADYGAVSGTATIQAGAPSTTVTVPIVNDALMEPDETFTLELSNALNAVLTSPSATVTILDDDSPAIFDDGFESGDWSQWSAAVP